MRCRECGTEYELQATHVCEMCFGLLDVVYDQAALKKVVSRDRIEMGPKSMWRYRDLLPIEDSVPVVTLGEGMTPLVKADRLGAELGLRNLYLKNDSMNPTNSFKDRVVSVAISWARAHGFETIACASTGNLANAAAAYAVRAGPAGQARHDRPVDRHRQPVRRHVRESHRSRDGRGGRSRDGRGDRRGHQAARPHRRNLHGDRRRRDDRGAGQAGQGRAMERR